jgi:hypothetical protein
VLICAAAVLRTTAAAPPAAAGIASLRDGILTELPVHRERGFFVVVGCSGTGRSSRGQVGELGGKNGKVWLL